VKLTPEEKEQINKATHYSMGDTMSSRIFPLIDEVLRKRGERIEALEKKCGLYMRGLEAEEKDCEALEAENAALRQQVERLSAPVTDACNKAAVEICTTYVVTAPRGVSFANRPPVTIAIIIEQALLAARKEQGK
jgi:hypothetical protein